MLERLRKGGIKYVFVSNSDNLGATLDLDLLAFFAKSDSAFTMEARTSFLKSRSEWRPGTPAATPCDEASNWTRPRFYFLIRLG